MKKLVVVFMALLLLVVVVNPVSKMFLKDDQKLILNNDYKEIFEDDVMKQEVEVEVNDESEVQDPMVNNIFKAMELREDHVMFDSTPISFVTHIYSHDNWNLTKQKIDIKEVLAKQEKEYGVIAGVVAKEDFEVYGVETDNEIDLYHATPLKRFIIKNSDNELVISLNPNPYLDSYTCNQMGPSQYCEYIPYYVFIAPGEYQMDVEMDGYFKENKTVKVKANEVVQCDILLEKIKRVNVYVNELYSQLLSEKNYTQYREFNVVGDEVKELLLKDGNKLSIYGIENDQIHCYLTIEDVEEVNVVYVDKENKTYPSLLIKNNQGYDAYDLNHKCGMEVIYHIEDIQTMETIDFADANDFKAELDLKTYLNQDIIKGRSLLGSISVYSNVGYQGVIERFINFSYNEDKDIEVDGKIHIIETSDPMYEVDGICVGMKRSEFEQKYPDAKGIYGDKYAYVYEVELDGCYLYTYMQGKNIKLIAISDEILEGGNLSNSKSG